MRRDCKSLHRVFFECVHACACLLELELELPLVLYSGCGPLLETCIHQGGGFFMCAVYVFEYIGHFQHGTCATLVVTTNSSLDSKVRLWILIC